MWSVCGYRTVGQAALPEAESARWNLRPRDTEWSLAHWVRVLRIATMVVPINPDSNENGDCQELMEAREKLPILHCVRSLILANVHLQLCTFLDNSVAK